MRSVRTLKILILCDIGLALLGFGTYALTRHSLPPVLQRFLAENRPPLGSAFSWVALAWLFLVVLSWIGLWRLWRRARALYTTAAGAGAVGTALMGPCVRSGPAEAFAGLSLVVTGLILGAIYMTELRQRFERSSRVPNGVA